MVYHIWTCICCGWWYDWYSNDLFATVPGIAAVSVDTMAGGIAGGMVCSWIVYTDRGLTGDVFGGAAIGMAGGMTSMWLVV